MQALTDNTIKDFAAAVRAELADLPKREVQELTDGLEADLHDRLSEEGESFDPGSAATYAAELREAAGVAPKLAKRKEFSSAALVQSTEDWFRKTAFGTALLEFGVSVRPVWWVLRVVVMFVILEAFRLPLWLFPVAAFLSIMWGRGTWFNSGFFKAILLPLNLIAILMIIPAADSAARTIDQYIANTDLVQSGAYANRAGLQLNGEQVLEIKAFDATGTEVIGLTYQDQNGNPLFEVQAEPIEVPDISGMTIPEFQAALTAVGIENVEINYLDDAEPVGDVVVLRTEPAIGSWIDPKSTLLVVMDHQK